LVIKFLSDSVTCVSQWVEGPRASTIALRTTHHAKSCACCTHSCGTTDTSSLSLSSSERVSDPKLLESPIHGNENNFSAFCFFYHNLDSPDNKRNNLWTKRRLIPLRIVTQQSGMEPRWSHSLLSLSLSLSLSRNGLLGVIIISSIIISDVVPVCMPPVCSSALRLLPPRLPPASFGFQPTLPAFEKTVEASSAVFKTSAPCDVKRSA
jgi:hypothetical protein